MNKIRKKNKKETIQQEYNIIKIKNRTFNYLKTLEVKQINRMQINNKLKMNRIN